VQEREKFLKPFFPIILEFPREILISKFFSNTFSNGMGSREGLSRRLRR
jgi:hypothetical protein